MGTMRRLIANLTAPVDLDAPGRSTHSLAGVAIPTMPGTSIPITENYATVRALTVAAVYRARQLSADLPACLPLTADDAPLPPPSADQDTQSFVTETILSLVDHGDAYWHLEGAGRELSVIPFADVTAEWADLARRRRRYRWSAAGGVELRTRGATRNLIVLSVNRGRGDLTGYGPMMSGRIRGLIAEQAYSQDYFENHAAPTGTLKVPGELTKEEAQAFRDQWQEARAARSPAVLAGGIEWQSTAFNPSDSDWVDTHLAGVGDVATLFGVPSTLLNVNQPGSSLTYENVGDVLRQYWLTTLAPTYARRIEAAWTDALGMLVRFDPEQLYTPQTYQRALTAKTLTDAGYDPAAAAAAAGLPDIPHTGAQPATLLPEDRNPNHDR